MIISWLAALIGISIGTVTDIQKREVADWLNYSLIAMGIGFSLTYSIIDWTYTHILYSAIGLAFAMAIGFIMYYTGQWGGGDAKLIMGLGALIGMNPTDLDIYELPWMIQFIINLVFAGAIYGFLWTGIIGLRHRQEFSKAFRKEMNSYRALRYIVMAIAIIGILHTIIFRQYIVFLVCACAFALFYIWVSVRVVERNCMIKKLPVSRLVEGDWIYQDVKHKGKRIISPSKTGITQKEIDLLKKKKIHHVIVREGVPFVPSFLIAFLITSFFSNWYMLI